MAAHVRVDEGHILAFACQALALSAGYLALQALLVLQDVFKIVHYFIKLNSQQLMRKFVCEFS